MPDDLPLSVWAAAEPVGGQHPRLLPGVARHAIRNYSSRGDLVLDPMCGDGTSLVEAMHLGRDAVGVSDERWRRTAETNIDLATRRGAAGSGRVLPGDWKHLDAVLAPALHGSVRLVLVAPPPRVWLDRHASNLLATCASYLTPDGFTVICTRPWRRAGTVFDAPNAIAEVAPAAGLVVIERNVALLAGLGEDTLLVGPRRASKTPRAAHGLHILAHQDVVVLRKP